MRERLLGIARTRCGEEVIRELAEIEDIETNRRRVRRNHRRRAASPATHSRM